MRLLTATLLICTLARVVAAEDEPWASEKPLVSPLRSFTIVQQREGNWSTTSGGNWSTTIHFQKAPAIQLTETYPWPASFYVSPDDHWMLQVQKSGSGDNISFLFRVDSNGRFWRMEPGLMKLAWTFIERSESLHQSDLYHTGIAFRSWDLRTQLLHFTFYGTYMQQSGVDVPLTYDLKRNVIKRDPKS